MKSKSIIIIITNVLNYYLVKQLNIILTSYFFIDFFNFKVSISAFHFS